MRYDVRYTNNYIYTIHRISGIQIFHRRVKYGTKSFSVVFVTEIIIFLCKYYGISACVFVNFLCEENRRHLLVLGVSNLRAYNSPYLDI